MFWIYICSIYVGAGGAFGERAVSIIGVHTAWGYISIFCLRTGYPQVCYIVKSDVKYLLAIDRRILWRNH